MNVPVAWRDGGASRPAMLTAPALPGWRLAWFLGLLLAAVMACEAAQPDLEREARLERQTRDAIFDGEPVDLEADGRRFYAIHMEPVDGEARGGIVLMHGRGFHPDWHQVVGPLRVSLAEAGWHTLSIQMPVLDKQARYNDYVPLFGHAHARIEAAIAYLREAGVEPVVLLAHSCSVHMSMDWVASGQAGGFDAYIGIGMGATDYGQPMAAPLPLERLGVPVLDVRGSDDYPAVHRLAPRRLKAMQAGGDPRSRQIVIDGANHYFDGQAAALSGAVLDWLQTLAH